MLRRSFNKLLTGGLIGLPSELASGQGPQFHDPNQESYPLPKTDSVDLDLEPKEPLKIRGRKQLFVDRYLVAHADEVIFTLVPPTKHPDNPIFYPDVPSDGEYVIPSAVMWNRQSKVFQLWYEAIHFETGEEIHLPAYAESDDGLEWRRPNLGVRDFNGSRDNNLVEGEAGMLIRDAHDTNPSRRYKLVTCVKDGVDMFFSGDGLHWTASAKNPVVPDTGDTHSLLGWDERQGKYIGYFRPKGNRPHSVVRAQQRQIGISFSNDAENWTPIVPIVTPDEHDPWGTEFYWVHALPYEDIYIGVLSVLHMDRGLLDFRQPDPVGWEQTVDMQLISSRDGIHWNRMGNRAPWLALGPYQSWDDQALWPAVPVLAGDQIRLYYSGISMRHQLADLRHGGGKKLEGRTRGGGMGLATLRRDGWVAARPNLHRRGFLTTRSFVLEGAGLEVNADASRGRVVVELLSADERPLPVLAGADGTILVGDSFRHPVRWNRPLTDMIGKAVRLRFTLERSDLYAFQFTM